MIPTKYTPPAPPQGGNLDEYRTLVITRQPDDFEEDEGEENLDGKRAFFIKFMIWHLSKKAGTEGILAATGHSVLRSSFATCRKSGNRGNLVGNVHSSLLVDQAILRKMKARGTLTVNGHPLLRRITARFLSPSQLGA